MRRSLQRAPWAACFLMVLHTVFAQHAEEEAPVKKRPKVHDRIKNLTDEQIEALKGKGFLDDFNYCGLTGHHLVGLLVVIIGQKLLLFRLKKNQEKNDPKPAEVMTGRTDAHVEKEKGAVSKGGLGKQYTPEEVAKKIAEGGVAIKYKVGEIAEIKYNVDPDEWVECKILDKGDEEHQWIIKIEEDAHQDAFLFKDQALEVSVLVLRKKEKKKDK